MVWCGMVYEPCSQRASALNPALYHSTLSRSSSLLQPPASYSIEHIKYIPIETKSNSIEYHSLVKHNHHPWNYVLSASCSFRELSILSGLILVLGSVFFAYLAKSGSNLLDRVEQREGLVKGATQGERKVDAEIELGVCREGATTGMKL